MFDIQRLRTTLEQPPRKIASTIGRFYALIGAGMFLMVQLQVLIMSKGNQEVPTDFMNTLMVLQDLVMVYMPLLVLLGLGYLAFGHWFHKLDGRRVQANYLLSILSLIWAIGYAFSSITYFRTFKAGLPNNTEFFQSFFDVLAGGGFVLVLMLMTIPQYTIGKKLQNGDHQQ